MTGPDGPTGPSAAFFDLDKTVIARSSSLAFSRPFSQAGLLNRRAVLRSAYAQFVYSLSGADHDDMERMRAYLQAMVTGWSADQVRQLVTETLDQLIQPAVYAEALGLIDEHQQAGRDVVIVSSSGADVVEPIAEMLGVVDVVATTLETDDDGRYTGNLTFYAYGPRKAAAMEALAEERGYDLAQCYAYSDSITDLPMLATVGHPCAVNPDRELRAEAERRGWPVLDFARPVGLQRRGLDRRAQVALGAGALAGVAWWAARSARGRA